MKKNFLVLALIFGMAACNSNSAADEKDPSTVQPPSENIPDSTKIVNDSVIMPDTTHGNGHQAGKSDSIQKSRH